MSDVRLGLVGYGVGGRLFHAPYVQAAEGVELVGVVTKNRRDDVKADLPGVHVFDSLKDLVEFGVDAVTITTPPATRRSLVLEALSLGVHVIGDKPFAPDAQGAQDLIDAAQKSGKLLSVFQNRRWDGDVRTLRALIDSERLGTLWRAHMRMDQDSAETIERGPNAGLLRDMGSHVVDQVLWLFGPALSVSCHLDYLDYPEGRTDVSFVLDILHESGVRSYIDASKANHADAKQWRVYGSEGNYCVTPNDVQFESIMAGLTPLGEGDKWGIDVPEAWGILTTSAGEEVIPAQAGRYQDFYSQFAAACRGEAELPVKPEQAKHTIEVLDAARQSAETGLPVALN